MAGQEAQARQDIASANSAFGAALGGVAGAAMGGMSSMGGGGNKKPSSSWEQSDPSLFGGN